ncbi:hypothetical protein HMPREF9960_1886 [Streptococcus cristatus ATCC 51100]|uniref:Uncharacterized protein n=1 Tax=Streptococcus cristatus ATCC 51100 TaxID=889201 RepID=A0AAV3EF31_STRCR|nr:hypothetical protein HMPREF9960_1886 [Streptococcus cristatus ATCC 51100]
MYHFSKKILQATMMKCLIYRTFSLIEVKVLFSLFILRK